MKNRLLFLMIIAFNFSQHLYAQKMASCEDNTDLFNTYSWTATDGSFGIVDNPSKTGINTTNKCILNHRIKGTSSAWTVSGDLTNNPLQPLAVTTTNHYLHVFVYSDQSNPGYIRLRYTALDDKWLTPSKEVRFNFTAGEWTDVVLDLNVVSATSIYGLYFLSQDWSASYTTDSYFYYDEIGVTSDPNPRGVLVIDTACTVANFEENGISPSFAMAGTSGGSVVQLTDNSSQSGVNETLKTLKIKQINETTWWCRANITFKNPVKVNNNTRYLHIKVKTPLSAISVLTYEPGEHWFVANIPTRNDWGDLVIDLMGSTYSLSNTILKSIGICANSSTYIPDMEWYIDEIAFSANSQARIGKVTFLDNIACDLTTEDPDWNFIDTNPKNTIKVTNNGTTTAVFTLNIDVRTAAKADYKLTQEAITLAAGETKTLSHELINPEPGFYRYYIDVTDGILVRNKVIRQIGYNPDKIVYTIDAQADFAEFWATAKTELAAVAPEYAVTYKQTKGSHLIYDVAMKSIKGKTIKGYLSVPNKTGKYPAIVVSNGYGTVASIPDRTDDYVVFNYNIRGQGISTDYTPADELFVNGLSDKNTYYYRDCYMDAIRSVDFICSREEVDTNKIFAEGESQGGALTYAIAALDSRILAAAPRLPFLSDFPGYYTIKENVTEIPEWPMDVLNQYMKKYSFNQTDAFKNLSYFDIKNLAGKIKCPVLMCVSLQDPICPPSINFAGYNQLQHSKEYMILKNNGHYSDASFITYKDAWFKSILDNLNTGIKKVYDETFSDNIKTYVDSNGINIHNTLRTPINIVVYKADGILMAKKTVQESSQFPLKSGIYILSISDNKHQMTRKIIVL